MSHSAPNLAPPAAAEAAADLLDLMSFGSGEVAYAPAAAAAGASRPPAQPRPAAAPAPTPAAGALAGFDELIAASARPSLMDADFFGALAGAARGGAREL